jgi:predicted nucleotidyltransferase
VTDKRQADNQSCTEPERHSGGERRAERLSGLALRTFPDLPYSQIREPRYHTGNIADHRFSDQHNDASPSTMRQLLAEHRAEILEVAARYGATNVRVFGSAARGQATGESDIDLIVDMAPIGDTLLRLAGLTEELTSLVGVKVDVATEELLREEIRDEAVADATPL